MLRVGIVKSYTFLSNLRVGNGIILRFLYIYWFYPSMGSIERDEYNDDNP